MIEADGGTTIEAPIERVFAFVADACNEPRWLPGARSVKNLTDGDVGLGTRFQGEYARAGSVSVELVVFEPPYRLTFRARSRIVSFDDAIVLSEHDGHTHLTAHMSAQPRGIMRPMAPLMARTMQRQFADNWQHLKAALEEPGAAAPA